MIIYKTAVTPKTINIILRENLNCKSMVNDSLQNNGNYSDDYKHYFYVSTTLQSSSFLIEMFSIFGVTVVLYFIKNTQ